MNVKKKLFASFSAIVILSIIMGIFGIFSIRNINSHLDTLNSKTVPLMSLIAITSRDLSEYRRIQLEHVISTDPQKQAGLEKELNTTEKDIDNNIEQYLKITSYKDKVLQFQDYWNSYKQQSKELIAISKQNDIHNSSLYTDKTKESYDLAFNALDELRTINNQAANTNAERSNTVKDSAIMLSIIILIIMLTSSLIISYKLSRYINNSLQIIQTALNKVRDGDFRITPRTFTKNDEFGALADSLADMRENVNKLLKDIHQSSETVASSSQELTASSDQSAQVTNNIAQSISDVAAMNEQQSDSVNTTFSAVKQISANIEEIASNANIASSNAEAASKEAGDGGDSIRTAISQMESIEKVVSESAAVVNELGERSKEIGMIVETITGIAEQTNLLALNAAIEAARAGDQGRGFAVVAEEVRKLAAESQEAAEKIANLIGTIQSQTENAVQSMNAGTSEVKKGSAIVKKSGIAFNHIIELNNGVAKQVKGIAQTTEEVAKASTNVTNAIQNVEQASKKVADQTQTVSAATEEQSASMEEIASASQNLAEIAQKLNEDVNRFKV